MVEVPITIACGNYDRTRAIRDGRVKVEGCEVTYLPLYPEEIFFRAFRYQEFDVSELSFSSYIRTVAAGDSAYVGHPRLRVAAVPAFRHLHPRRLRHPRPRRPARQAHRPAGIPDHRGGLDARHDAARIRRAADRNPLAQRRPGGGGTRRAHAAQADRGPRSQADRQGPDAGRHAARRRARRFVHGAGAVIVPARRTPYQAPVSQHARSGAGLLQEDPHVSADAPRRHPQGAGAEISLARRPASTRRSAKPRRSP